MKALLMILFIGLAGQMTMSTVQVDDPARCAEFASHSSPGKAMLNGEIREQVPCYRSASRRSVMSPISKWRTSKRRLAAATRRV